ncbi:MAG: prepilin-type N-terminal cleavage/methylation domain-containing protein [Proteobacteria bacterium]|nr:prepilin-type N-terminal cleavage/methylation domain-containing protein [Pseudomonadota bacterium]
MSALLQRTWHRRRQRGVSLIEALVAMAVMGFGMLGVVAMQSALRQNSDIAKQRTEATRLAQTAIESRRAVSAMTTTAGKIAWTDLVSPAPETIAGTNATYLRTVTIPDLGSGRSKNFVVDVQWTDRAGNVQSVRLVSAITGNLTELAATVGIPPLGGSKTRPPRGRHASIPPTAIDQSDGTSKFTPPGSTGYWVFNNTTGYIEKNCNSSDVCATVYWRLLAGFVDFQTSAPQPTPAQGENPSSAAFPVSVSVDVSGATCFQEPFSTYYAYYCAVPVDPLTGAKWSGMSTLGFTGLAANSEQMDADHYRVCRYTPVRDCDPLVGDTIWGAEGSTASCTGASPTPQRKMTNAEHPKLYANVTESLVSQNFLIIRADFSCPDDDTSTPLIQSTTWNHQP